MRIHKGYVLGLVGLAVLALSLVVSRPDPAESGPVPSGPKPAGEARPSAVAPPSEVPPPGTIPFHAQPLQETGVFRFQAGQHEAFLSILVPSGLRLEVEQLTFRAGLADGERVIGSIATLANGGAATHVVPMAYQGTLPKEGRVHAGSRRLRAYADGGTTIQLKLERTGTADGDTGWFSLSGVLVPLN